MYTRRRVEAVDAAFDFLTSLPVGGERCLEYRGQAFGVVAASDDCETYR